MPIASRTTNINRLTIDRFVKCQSFDYAQDDLLESERPIRSEAHGRRPRSRRPEWNRTGQVLASLRPPRGKADLRSGSNVRCELQHGFSLIEVLLFLLVVLVLVIILLTSASSLTKTRGVHLDSIANEIATCEIEQLRKTAFASLPGTGAIGAPCDQDMAKLHDPKSATRTIANFQGNSNIKQVIITVSWTESGIAKNLTLETLISKYGL